MTRTAWAYSIGINDLIHEQDRSSTVAKNKKLIEGVSRAVDDAAGA